MPPGMQLCFQDWDCEQVYWNEAAQAVSYLKESGTAPDLILMVLDNEHAEGFMHLRHQMLKSEQLKRIPFVAITDYPSPKLQQMARKFQTNRLLYTYGAYSPALCDQISQLLEPASPATDEVLMTSASHSGTPWWKRAIDILGASVLILLLSPLLLLCVVLIKLESRGPVFYISKRAGQGYKVFDFYKFRSMRTDADAMLKELRQQNEYSKEATDHSSPQSEEIPTEAMLFRDSGYVSEADFLAEKQEEKAGTFVKIKNDPRVTRFGRFIRKTSIDELPQLFNVLKGDMSLVGNRPIPLYEAEQLTTDEYIARFFAPAGITGLWQITKSQKNNMSERERKLLDVEYAQNYNFWMDMRILWRTLPAALQRDNA